MDLSGLLHEMAETLKEYQYYTSQFFTFHNAPRNVKQNPISVVLSFSKAFSTFRAVHTDKYKIIRHKTLTWNLTEKPHNPFTFQPYVTR